MGVLQALGSLRWIRRGGVNSRKFWAPWRNAGAKLEMVMIGGTMKTTSRFALAAAAGLFVGSLAISPAQAADLGGDCCADLEERVAELEATTVRKGNRVVSVQLYGQVNKAILVWDDGIESDAYIVDNDVSSSRWGLKGSGMMKPGWKAGFKLEFEADGTAAEGVDQFQDEGGGPGALTIRKSEVYVESERFGRVTLAGEGSEATDDLTLINLGGTAASGQDSDWIQGFEVRGPADAQDPNRNFSPGFVAGNGAFNWGNLMPGLDTSRRNVVKYDSPSVHGFILSAAWGENDYADVALRFSREWNSIRFAAGIGYSTNTDPDQEGNVNSVGGVDEERFSGSASIMHVPSGVYLTGAYAAIEWDNAINTGGNNALLNGADPTYWYLQGGIRRNWTGYGATVLYAEYGQYDDFAVGVVDDYDQDNNVNDVIVGSDATMYGFGVEQNFDSAAFTLFATVKYYEAEVDFDDNTNCGAGCQVDGTVDAEDFVIGAAGMKIKF